MIRSALAIALLFAPITNPIHIGEPPITQAATEPHTPLITEMMLTGSATWFDATRDGKSTWYTREGIVYYGAIGATIRHLKQHYWLTSWEVRITTPLTGKSVIVHVVDECTCYGVRKVRGDEPLIDLSPATWDALGVRLGRGIMPITLQILP
jgi:hypothetical protein